MTLGGADHPGRVGGGRSRGAIAAIAGARQAQRGGAGRRARVLREKIAAYRKERALLEARVSELERASRRLYASYVEAEAQSTHLAHLFVTVERLRAARGRGAIYTAIRELVESIVGSSELAIFELDEDGAHLQLGGAFGIDPTPYTRVPLACGRIGQVVASGQPYFSEGDVEESDGLTACVALTAEGQRVGALAVFRLLAQKPALSAADHEILRVLAAHAGAALRDSARPARRAPGEAACPPVDPADGELGA
ncbi:MAG TPA: GAF domain-containing protein [Sorangium sp.]|nr:GAF domain-containing protein [Sorangium sp.]